MILFKMDFITDLRIKNVSWLRENKCYNILLCWFDGFLTNKVWIFCTYNLATSALSGTVAHPLHWLFIECYNKKGMVQAPFVCKFLALCRIIRSKILTRKPEWISYNDVKLFLRYSHFGKKKKKMLTNEWKHRRKNSHF